MNRVVITGIGCCTSLGWEQGGIARAFAGGCPAFAPSEALPGYSACPISDLGDDAANSRFSGMAAPPLSEPGMRALAVLSGLRAAASAGFDPHMPPQTCLIGASGPMLDFDRENGLPPADSEALDALWLLRWLPNTGNTALARFLDIHGEGLVIGTACASALQAIGEGFRRVRYGLSETVLCSSGDSRLSRGGMLGYAKAHALSRNPVPSEASRPFDEARDGFVPGEGGAAFVLESLESARARGAAVFAEILGFGASLDGGRSPRPTNRPALRSRRYGGRLPMRALSPMPSIGFPHTVRGLPSMTGVRPYCWRGFLRRRGRVPP